MLKVFWGKAERDGKIYYGDLIISPDASIAAWEHETGEIRNLFIIHRLMTIPEDLLEGVKVVVIGQGHLRFLQAGSGLKRSLKDKGILLKQARSRKAAADFMRMNSETECLLLLHTKC